MKFYKCPVGIKVNKITHSQQFKEVLLSKKRNSYTKNLIEI